MSAELPRVAGLCRHNLKLWLADVQVPILLVGMPLVMIVFLRPVYRDGLAELGVTGATGAEQAVPGMAVMFALFGASILSTELHRERQWGTWERLRSSGARTSQILVGKLLPPLLVIAGQLTVLFLAGVAVFGLRVEGSPAGLALVAGATALTMLALGLAMAALVRSITRLAALGNAMSVTLAGLGGALVPVAELPAWAQLAAPLTPSYWAVRGFQAAILETGGFAEAVHAALVLTGFTLALGALAAWRFRLGET